MDARVLLTVLLTVCLAEDTLAVNPGFKTTITSKGLDYSKWFMLYCIKVVAGANK